LTLYFAEKLHYIDEACVCQNVAQLAAAVGPAADGDETKFAVKRRRSGVEIITKEDAKFQSVDRTLNSETSYSAGESLSSLVSMKESCTVTKLPERTSLMQQDYIHVRARRGEATDSHSIAERVKRLHASSLPTSFYEMFGAFAALADPRFSSES
jgi:hypothetical protein